MNLQKFTILDLSTCRKTGGEGNLTFEREGGGWKMFLTVIVNFHDWKMNLQKFTTFQIRTLG